MEMLIEMNISRKNPVKATKVIASSTTYATFRKLTTTIQQPQVSCKKCIFLRNMNYSASKLFPSYCIEFRHRRLLFREAANNPHSPGNHLGILEYRTSDQKPYSRLIRTSESNTSNIASWSILQVHLASCKKQGKSEDGRFRDKSVLVFICENIPFHEDFDISNCSF